MKINNKLAFSLVIIFIVGCLMTVTGAKSKIATYIDNSNIGHANNYLIAVYQKMDDTIFLMSLRNKTKSGSMKGNKTVSNDCNYNKVLYTQMPKFRESVGLSTHDMRNNVINKFPKGTYHVIRDDIDWSYVEKKKNEYTYDKYVKQLKSYQKTGIKGQCIFTFNNPIYKHDGEKSDNVANIERVEAYKRFVLNFLRYMKSQDITGLYVEIINEPNIDIFFSSDEDFVKSYVDIVKSLYNEIKKIDETAVVVTCNFAAGVGFSEAALSDIDKALSYGIADYTDAISIHPYINGIPEKNIKLYEKMNYIVKEKYKEDIPIICGEFGYSICEGKNYKKGYKILSTEQNRSEYIPRALLNNVRYGILITDIYCHRKTAEDASDNSEKLFGIYNMDGSPTETALAIKKLVDEIGDMVYAGVYIDNGNYVVLQFIDEEGLVSYVGWSYDSSNDIELAGQYYTLTTKPTFIKGTGYQLRNAD